MKNLGKIELDQINTYIMINEVINHLDVILHRDEKHNDIEINNEMKQKIYEFTGINIEMENLDKSDIQELSSILKLSLTAIDMSTILLKRLLAVLEIA